MRQPQEKMNKIKKKTKRIPQLEGLRFIMCCIIILSHFEFLSKSKLFGDGYIQYLHNATMAVDYFFMISGFGICLSKKRSNNDLKSRLKFAIDKVKKIYGAYIISLIIAIPISMYAFMEYSSIFKAGAKTLFYFCVNLSLLQSVFGMTSFSHAINGVCWFLSCIFVCYFFITWVIKWIDKIESNKNLLFFLMLTVILVIVLSYGCSKIEALNLMNGKIDDLWYGHAVIRCWYLVIGAFIGKLYKKNKIEFGNISESIIILISIIYFLLRNSLLIVYNKNFLRLIDIILCSALLFVISKGKGKITEKLSKEYMVKLGHLSMYLYLFHYPIRMTIGELFKQYGIIRKVGESGYILECIVIIAITICWVIGYEKLQKELKHSCIKNMSFKRL